MIIGGRSGYGKTHELILLSARKNKRIWTADHKRSRHILEMAKEMKVEILSPMVLSKENLELQQRYELDESMIIDDLEAVLSEQFGINIDVASTNMRLRKLVYK